MQGSKMYGRRVIYSDKEEITPENVIEVLDKALAVHNQNRSEIQYLFDYYKGRQPILERTKEYRKEICNRIVENRANEIVSFKVGYLMGEPVQYVSRGSDEDGAYGINKLNEYVFEEDKAAKDKELADWFTICGTAYRMVLPDRTAEDGDSPFNIYTLDPRNSFVVYHSGLGNKPLMGVRYVLREDGSTVYSVYTSSAHFEITQPGNAAGGSLGGKGIAFYESHILGGVPIVEYPANSARMGAFEAVLPILDAINNVASNRIDGVEQFIQAILVFQGIDPDNDDVSRLKEEGGIAVPPDGKVSYLTQELNQTQTQTLVDYLYQTVLTICGMPNRNGGTSTSDTGSAVIMRDGWSAAEARAKDTELMFKMSEKRFLRLAVNIANTYRDINIRPSDIEIRFTRRNYENIQAKAQVLSELLSNEKVHPRLAFEHCGMFVDPELAYRQSCEYSEKQKEDAAAELQTLGEYARVEAGKSTV